MDLFDTHCHFEGTADETALVLARAKSAGIARIMAVGGSQSLNRGAETAMRLAAEDPSLPRVCKALGYDRDQAALGSARPPLELTDCTAVGEIGLDYFYDGAPRKEQCALFASQLELARARDLSVVIHTREADDDTLALLREIPVRGIIHCFTGSPDFCRALLDLGFYISYSGIVTFRAAENVRETARLVPDDRLLIETDSPFLAPVPMRGKTNEPAFLVHTAKFLADLRKMPLDAFAALTMRNACDVLRLGSGA